MTYWLFCICYVAIRQELVDHPYKGVYYNSDAWVLWFAATIEIIGKLIWVPITITADMVRFFDEKEFY